MFSKNYFTISNFAKLMGISRQTLIYYDRIGLFKPVKTLDSGYRLYSRNQINVISLISMLSEMGVPLKEIKPIVDNISPDTALEILKKQLKDAKEKLFRLQMLENMLSMRIGQIAGGDEILKNGAPPFAVTKIEDDIPLYIGEEINCPWNEIPDDFIIDFYAKCEELNFPLIFTSGHMRKKENLIMGKSEIISNLCFCLKDSAGANAVIPKGTYVCGYALGDYDYDNTNTVYQEMLAFIKEKGMKIAGNAYGEYLLDELAESDPDKFVLKIMIQVDYCK